MRRKPTTSANCFLWKEIGDVCFFGKFFFFLPQVVLVLVKSVPAGRHTYLLRWSKTSLGGHERKTLAICLATTRKEIPGDEQPLFRRHSQWAVKLDVNFIVLMRRLAGCRALFLELQRPTSGELRRVIRYRAPLSSEGQRSRHPGGCKVIFSSATQNSQACVLIEMKNIISPEWSLLVRIHLSSPVWIHYHKHRLLQVSSRSCWKATTKNSAQPYCVRTERCL